MSAVSVVFNMLDGAKDMVLGLPFALYGTFVVEQKHGFNKQTLGLFLMDQLKSVSLPLRSLTPCNCCMAPESSAAPASQPLKYVSKKQKGLGL